MSTAQDKNRQAFVSLLGSEALADKLVQTRLAVRLPDSNTPAGAQLLAEVLADALGRLWPNIDFHGAKAEQAMVTAKAAAESGDAPTDGIRVGWAPPYDFVIGVGTDPGTEHGNALQVGADGWTVQLGSGAYCRDDTNPVGPAFAASLAAAQAFVVCFGDALEGFGVNPLRAWQTDLRVLFDAPNLTVQPLDVAQTHVFGVGAVSHSLLWLLERWPEPVSGYLALVDRDRYGSGNGQRYAFMHHKDKGHLKVTRMAERLRSKHPLRVTPHDQDLNTYCATRGYDQPLYRAIAGLDSEEARRHVALKLPQRTINMWTSGMHVGAGQYVPGDGRGCLACAYPEPVEKVMDEVAEIYAKTQLRPDIVRDLLDSARGLTAEEAQLVAQKFGLAPDRVAGEPLRSVLPMLCATAHVPMAADKSMADVPFAFSSLFAGIAGFMMLLRDVQLAESVSDGWSQHVLKAPSSRMLQPQSEHELCVRCAAMKTSDITSPS